MKEQAKIKGEASFKARTGLQYVKLQTGFLHRKNWYKVHNLHFRHSTWNHDKCKAVGTLLVSDDATNAAIDMLQGKAFWQDPGMGLSGEDIKIQNLRNVYWKIHSSYHEELVWRS